MILTSREIGRIGLRDRSRSDDFPTRQAARRARRAFRRRARHRLRTEIIACHAHGLGESELL
ncbi:hypothetical protein AB0N17_38250 [Streptomyces sp. NPDC051133]|uniref:hypothetical protein n=1 Tax=Streptomyces sp. NPDC051133 TaxID=3155521 RepID=UPI00343837C5